MTAPSLAATSALMSQQALIRQAQQVATREQLLTANSFFAYSTTVELAQAVLQIETTNRRLESDMAGLPRLKNPIQRERDIEQIHKILVPGLMSKQLSVGSMPVLHLQGLLTHTPTPFLKSQILSLRALWRKGYTLISSDAHRLDPAVFAFDNAMPKWPKESFATWKKQLFAAEHDFLYWATRSMRDENSSEAQINSWLTSVIGFNLQKIRPQTTK